MRIKTIVLGALAGVVAVAAWRGYTVYEHRTALHERIAQVQNVVVPKAQPKPTPETIAQIEKQPKQEEEVNWDVPFTPQAPLANWDAVHEEACEEASVLMVLKYFAGKPIGTPAEADQAILRLVDRNEHILGFAVDQTAQQVAALIALENNRLRVSVVAHPSENSIKQALARGFLVIVPAAGRQLKNPYFQQPGPLYHMLVIRGYTKDGYVITNDPGTKRGAGFLYPWQTLLDAIHDWNNGDVDHGDKVMILVGQYVIGESAVGG